MTKPEFQQKIAEGMELIEKKNYSGAVDFFDEVNLDPLKDPRALQSIAKAYEKCRRYADAEDLLLQAHECAPRSRGTLFHLCTVAIKGGDLAMAMKYYNDFCQIAKYDAERYILQYRIAQAEGRDDEELIKILENFKGEEPDDRWMYELAKLYTTNNRTNDALEVCDEITLWFYNGKYVQLAKELRAYLTGEALEEDEETPQDTNYGYSDYYGSTSPEPESNEMIPAPDEDDEAANEEENEEEAVEAEYVEENADEFSLDDVKTEFADASSEEEIPAEFDEQKDVYAESMYAPESMPADKYAELSGEDAKTDEGETDLTFVPDQEVFSEGNEEAPEFSQHSIFSPEAGLEIREMDEAEALPEGEETLQDAIKEAFPESEWELDDSVPETQAIDEVTEETEAAPEKEAWETPVAEQVEETEVVIEEAEAENDTETETSVAEPEEDEKEVAEEAAKQDFIKTAQEEALKAKTEESVDTESWAHVTFNADVEDDVVFAVTGETLRTEDADVSFDDSIFTMEEETADHRIDKLNTYSSEEILAEAGLDTAAAAPVLDAEPTETEAEAPAETEGETTEPEATETETETTENEVTPTEAEAPAETETETTEPEVTETETPAETEAETPETIATATEAEKEAPVEDEWKRPSEELNELEDLEQELEKKHASSEKLGDLPIEPETGKNTWHFIVFGETEAETLERAQEILKEFTETIPNCPRRMLKTSAKRIENANIIESLDHFLGSMVIIQNAASLSDNQLRDFSKVLEKDDNSLLIVFTDTEENFEKMFERVPELSDSFTAAYEGHRVTARDLVNAAKEFLYYQDALMTRDAEGVCYEYARKLIAERKGFYRSSIREYAGRALRYAEHNGLFGMFSGSVDEDGFLHVTEKFFKKAGER